MAFLSSQQIYKSFTKEKKALSNINMEVEKGEIVALLGESGSGKTTLLRIIAGFETPDAGTLNLNDTEITFLKPEKRNIGMIFQDYALFPHLTVVENIQFGMKHLSKELKYSETNSLLQLLQIDELKKRYPHQISGGQQQRVAIARSIAAKPEMLLLDEPFSNLDKSLKDSVRKEIRNILKKTSTTAIFVTHDIEDAVAVADKIVILKDGIIQQQATYFDLYYTPANIYVASISSILQVIIIDGEKKYLRPEAIHLSEQITFYKALVLENRFVGFQYEIYCSMGNDNFYFYHGKPLVLGETIHLNFNEKLIWKF
jgi:iron(III) transport system ATP-binding protein